MKMAGSTLNSGFQLKNRHEVTRYIIIKVFKKFCKPLLMVRDGVLGQVVGP